MAPSTGTSPDEIAHFIRNAIAEGVYPPGTTLSQVELAARFDVSRIPLREAMRTLIAEGLLTQTTAGRSIAVRSLDRARIEEIYQLRRMIEPSFAAEVIRNLSRADLEDLANSVIRMESVETDPDTWSQLNFAFHLRMYRIAALPIRYEVISQLYYLLEPYSRAYVHNSGGRPRAQLEHQRMMSALRAGDEAGLSSAILDHVDGGLSALARAADS